MKNPLEAGVRREREYYNKIIVLLQKRIDEQNQHIEDLLKRVYDIECTLAEDGHQ